MGNRATPSVACAPCRAKRRKCSLERPQCAQCLRAQTKCHGYRDAFTLKLHDETLSTARRVQNKKGRGKMESRSALNETSSQEDSNLIHAGCARLVGPVKQSKPPQEAALVFFMNVWAKYSTFYFLPDHYSQIFTTPTSAEIGRRMLDMAISTVGLALLGKELRQPSLVHHAFAQYTTVLVATQRAVSDPKLATLDSTLLCILLLGLFEGLVFRGRSDPTAWDSHFKGAATLLRLRGKDQLSSSLGRHLYMYTSGTIMRAYGLRALILPPAVRDFHLEMTTLLQQDEKLSVHESLGLRISSLIDKIGHIRSCLKSSSWPRLLLLTQLNALDKEIDEISVILEQRFPYTTLPTEYLKNRSVNAFGSVIHIYLTPLDARCWNTLRFLRLFTCEAIYNISKDPPTENTASTSRSRFDLEDRMEQAWRTAQPAAHDILHSVPYLVELSEAPGVSAASLLLHLSGVAISDVCCGEAKTFARERLMHFSKNLNCPHAEAAMSMVHDSLYLEKWVPLVINL